MHGTTHAMPNEFPDDTEPVAFNVVLDGPRDVSHPVASQGLSNSLVKSLLGHIHEPLRQDIAAADRHGSSCIADEPVENDANIQADNIAKLHPPITGQPMHNLLVHRDAQMTRVFAVAKESAARTVFLDNGGSQLINLASSQARANLGRQLIQHCGRDHTSPTHGFDFSSIFQDNHYLI